MSRKLENLPAGACGECGHDRIGRIRQESDRAVGEEEVRAARMQAPVVECVAHVVDPTGGEAGGQAPAVGDEGVAGRSVLANSEYIIGHSGPGDTEPGVPPAVPQIFTWWPLSDQERIARAVGDVGKTHQRIGVERSVTRAQGARRDGRCRGTRAGARHAVAQGCRDPPRRDGGAREYSAETLFTSSPELIF